MLAGHILILTFIGLIFILESLVLAVVRDPGRDALLPLRGRDRGRDPGVHLRRPVRHLHRLGDRAGALEEEPQCLSYSSPQRRGDVTKAGKAIGLALGVGLGALGAGVGIGNIFGSMIQSGRPPARAPR